VIFNLPESFLPQILKAQSGGKDVPAEAYDRDMKNKLATGKLLAVDSQIDQTTGTIRCRAMFDNKDEALFPNQFVNMRLLVDTRKDVILVPLAALQHSPKTDFVYVVKEDQTVEMRPVSIGTSEGEQLIIEKGVNPDETVVVEGVDKLQPGMKVTMPQPSDEGLAKGGKSRGGKKEGKTSDGKPRSPNAPGASRVSGS
jgi:multidrug efflux system membrane fusion protein